MPKQSNGYPVELILDQGQTLAGGYLSSELLPWQASNLPLEDGQRLFSYLFQDINLRQAWAEIRGDHPQRRIRLHIDPHAPALHTIPWELLRDVSPGQAPQTLAADSNLPFSRYLPGEHDPGKPISERPLKMLVAIADPSDLAAKGFAPIDKENEEYPVIKAALAGISQDELQVTYMDGPVTLDALADTLAEGYHILHLIAHGQVENNQTTLILAGEDNQAVEISDIAFVQKVANLPQLPQLIYLVSCQSATRSPADAWRGLAPKLIQVGVPAVLAMQDVVSFETAQHFTTAFYQTLLWKQGGWVDLAANEARSSLMNRADFKGAATPVLYSRLMENRLFKPAQQVDSIPLTEMRRRQLDLLARVQQQPWFMAEGKFLGDQITFIQEDRGAVYPPFPDLNLSVPDDRIFPATYRFLDHLRQADETALLILTPAQVNPIDALQQIAHDAAELTQTDPDQATPVLFNLGHWNKGDPLDSWLIEELQGIDNNLSEAFARTLLEEKSILILLTGLASLAIDMQMTVVIAINQFRETFQTPLVVACPADIYDTLDKKFEVTDRLKLDNTLRLHQTTTVIVPTGETVALQVRIQAARNGTFPVELSVNSRQQFTGHQISLNTLPPLSKPPIEADGEQLFIWLMGRGSLRTAWEQIRQQGAMRHIQLHIDPNEAAFHDIPWESLRDPSDPGQPLASAPHTTFARFYHTNRRSVMPQMERPLKVLVALANPTDLAEYQGRTSLTPAEEQALLEQACFKIDKSELQLTFIGHENPLTLADLQNALLSGYHLLHIIGCAAFIQEQPVLYLADSNGQVDLDTTITRVAEMLQSLPHRPQLIILNDGQDAPQPSAAAWRKMAPALLEAGIPAVIAAQAALSPDNSYAFLRPLYEELVTGSGQADIAISTARASLPPTIMPPPILYTRITTPHLFDQQQFDANPIVGDDRRNQLTLLHKVREYWVEGVYEQSLQEVTKIELKMEAQLGTIERTLIGLQQDDQYVPPDQRMIDLFDQLNGALLILGSPGAGKTFALLELARDLILRAERTVNHPIPVVFNLSSWQDSKQSITQWLVAELSVKYYIPRKIGQRWVEDKKILPLLDGLDEVREGIQANCVEAINRFHQENLVGLAVCSRTEEYEQLEAKLDLAGTVRLHPLSPEQIDDYLQRAGPELAAVRETLQYDKPLQDLAETPLMLNVMALAYKGKSAEEIKGFNTVEDRRHDLFYEYVQKMFNPIARRVERTYPDQQTIVWLHWLAHKMRENNLSVFLIEQLQPTWLAQNLWQKSYLIISRIFIGLIGGFLGGIIISMSSWVAFGASTWYGKDGLLYWLNRGLAEGMLGGVIGGITAGLIEITWLRARHKIQNWPLQLQLVVKMLVMGTTVWLAVWLGIGSILGLLKWNGLSLEAWFNEGIPVGALVGMAFGLLSGTRNKRLGLRSDIQIVEYLSWSAKKASRGGIFGALAGFLTGVIFGSIESLNSNADIVTALQEALRQLHPNYALTLPLVAAPIFGATGLILGGLSGSIFRQRSVPNQGIRLSLKNALFMGGVGGIVMGIAGGLTGLIITVLISGQVDTVIYVTLFGLYGVFFSVVMALWYGGLDVIQHYILRACLRYFEKSPLNYRSFLDYAIERIFLRRVGGGFIFIHRLLQEYFAKLEIIEGDEATEAAPYSK